MFYFTSGGNFKNSYCMLCYRCLDKVRWVSFSPVTEFLSAADGVIQKLTKDVETVCTVIFVPVGR